MIRRLIPLPGLTLAITALWLVLAKTPDAGNALLGLAAGITLPLATRRFWPDAPRISRWGAAIRLALIVLYDIVVANFEVARLVLGPVNRLRSDFVDVPLDINDPFVVTLLGSIVSLTPGTVTTHIDMDRGIMRVHALDVPDAATLITSIKTRYERLLKEAFGC